MIKEAVILAGGEGTRLRPVTLEIPKPLVPVQGVPILTWLARLFAKHGVERVTVIYPTRWKEVFVDWSSQAHLIDVRLFEEKEKMGTLGALVHEFDLPKDSFFVTNGDELKGLDLTQLADAHQASREQNLQRAVTIALVRVPNPSEYGVAEMEEDLIAKFHEKPEIPPSTLISSGLYVVEPSVLAEIDRSKRFLMFEKDLFPRLAAERRLGGCALDGAWYDCGTMQRWEKAIMEWRGLEGGVDRGSILG